MTVFNFFVQLYRATNLQEEKDRILQSFSGVTDFNLVDDILRFSQSVGVLFDINLPVILKKNSICSSHSI